jgi:putative tricarboxylic transport membrane protein
MTTAAGWRPEREIEIIAGTAAGGGLDRTARAFIAAIEAEHLLDVPVRLVNMPGDGGRKPWPYLDTRAGDPHVLSISSPNLTTDRLTGLTSFDHDDYTPLAILCNEYIAFAARTDSPLRNGADLLQALRVNARGLRIALSTSLGNPNHIALAEVARHAGADAKALAIRVFDSALDAVADVVAGHADIAVVTAASPLKEMAAGNVRVLAVSAPARLAGPYADVETWEEQDVPCETGAWRGLSGPRGLTPAHIEFWSRVGAWATASAAWRAALATHCWAPYYLDGATLTAYLREERAGMKATLGALGLAT